MRRFKGIGLVVVAALILTGVAIGNEGEGRSTKAVTAAFSAELGDFSVKTCTGADGKYRRTQGDWAGTVTGDPALAGDLEIHGSSFVHVPTGVGTFEGRIVFGDEETGFKGSLNGVVKGGKLDGLLIASRDDKNQRLVANVSVTLKDGDFTAGRVGSDGGVDAGVLFKGSACAEPRKGKPEQPKEPSKPEQPKQPAEKQVKEVHGTITALSRDSITVNDFKCEVLAANAAEVLASYKTGDKVVAWCYLEDGHYHLQKLKKEESAPATGANTGQRQVKEGAGTVAALAAGSISVTLAEKGDTLTCSLTEAVAAELQKNGVAVGLKVKVQCVSENGLPFALVRLTKA